MTELSETRPKLCLQDYLQDALFPQQVKDIGILACVDRLAVLNLCKLQVHIPERGQQKI